MDYLQAVILGIVEGLTEFLPVSSTGHLTITEKILGLQIDDKGVTAYTAVIQMGAILAVLIYFRSDIGRIAVAWLRGLVKPEFRGTFDHRFGWYIIVGSVPIGIVGFLGKDLVSGPLRSLWVVAVALVLWSAVMVVAERVHARRAATAGERGEGNVTVRDGLLIGLVQCFSLVPGVSRSGATISAGLLRGLDRVTATRLSFFMAIPALTAAGLYEAASTDLSALGKGQMAVGILIAFVVALASIAWLLRFVAHHTLTWFVGYRIAAGVVIAALLLAGTVTAT